MQVKFCGLTRLDDIAEAVALGVDALGFVFYPPSPRAVTPLQASELIKAVPAFVSVVALVVNMDKDTLFELASTVPFDVIQFHGDESADECQKLAELVNKRWIKALRINEETHDLERIRAQIDEFIASKRIEFGKRFARRFGA